MAGGGRGEAVSLPYPWWNANRLNLAQNHICSKAMSAMACVSRRQHFTVPPYPPAGMFFLPPLPWCFLNLGFSFFLTFGFLYPIYKTLVRNLELVSTKITCELELCPVVFRKKGNSEAWWNGSLPAPVGARSCQCQLVTSSSSQQRRQGAHKASLSRALL